MFQQTISKEVLVEVLKTLGETVLEKKKKPNGMVSIYDLLKELRKKHEGITKGLVEECIDYSISKGVIRYFHNKEFKATWYGVSQKGWDFLKQYNNNNEGVGAQ